MRICLTETVALVWLCSAVTEQQIKELFARTPENAMEQGMMTFNWGKRAARAIGVGSDIQVEASVNSQALPTTA